MNPKAAPEEQTIVLIGNSAPMMQVPVFEEAEGTRADGSKFTYHRDSGQRRGERHPVLNQSVTRAHMWVGFDDSEFVNHTLSTDNDRLLAMIARQLSDEDKKYAVGIREVESLFEVHSGNSKPAWIDSNDPEFAKVLAEHFGCPAGEPTALMTNVGKDALFAQHVGTGAQPAAFNYIGLTANNTAPAAGDTTLTGEITTAGGGLLRAQGTYAHTAGTNTATLTKTFTANGSDSLPVVLAKAGVFNASTAGTMGYETLLNSTSTLNVSGDSSTLTWTDTAT